MAQMPEILDQAHFDDAVKLVRRYYGLQQGSTRHIGASFETIGRDPRGIDVGDVVQAGDLVALSTLSVDVSGASAVDILGKERSQAISLLLEQIPQNVSLIDDEAAALVADDGPASLLWTEVRKVPGFGPTRTSKLLARKRPLLIPIYDSVVRDELGLKSSRGHWTTVRELVTQEDGALWGRAIAIGEKAGIGVELSPLRIIDIVLWRHGKDAGRASVDDAGGEPA